MVDEVGVRLSLKDRQQFSRETSAAAHDLSKIRKEAERIPAVFRRGLNGVQSFGRGVGNAMSRAATGVERFATRSAQAVGVAGVAIGGLGVKAVASFETAEVAFSHMLGSGDRARSFLEGLQEFANKTPFEFPQLVTAARRMLALGFNAQQIRPMLSTIGDAAAGLGTGAEGVDRMVTALGQMRTKNRVMAQEMNQLTETGVNAWQILADASGKSTGEIMKAVELGLITADQAIPVLLAGMDRQFSGLMGKQSKTIEGLWSTFVDESRSGLRKALDPFKENIKGAIRGATGAVGGLFAGLGGKPGDDKKGAAGFFQRVGYFARRDAIPAVQRFGRTIMPIVRGFSGWVTHTGWPALQRFGGWLQARGPAFKEFVSGVVDGVRGAFDTLSDGIERNEGTIGRIVDEVLPAMGDFFREGLPYLASLITRLLDGLTGLVDLWDRAGAAVERYGDALRTLPGIGPLIGSVDDANGDGKGGGGPSWMPGWEDIIPGVGNYIFPGLRGSSGGGRDDTPALSAPALSLVPPPRPSAEPALALSSEPPVYVTIGTINEALNPENTYRAVRTAVRERAARG